MHFSNEILKVVFLAALASAAPIVDSIEQDGVLVENLDDLANLTTRQNGGPDGACIRPRREKKWVVVDDGSPHQNFVFKQITDSVQCDNSPGNGVSSTEGLTVGWSFSIGGSISATPPGTKHGAGASADISYSVSKSTTTTIGRNFGCSTDDGSQDGSICGFERVQVTAVTMKEVECQVKCPWDDVENVDIKFCKDTGAPTMVAFAPNDLQGGGTDGKAPACHYSNFQLGLPCVIVGNEIHSNPSSIPGGPQFVGCDDRRSAPGQ